MAAAVGNFEQLILFAILRLEDEAYGATIRQTIEQRTGRGVSTGAMYTTLRRMEERGLVTSWFGEPTPERGGRRKKFYRLEAEGLLTLDRCMSDFRAITVGLNPRLAELVAQLEHPDEP